MDRLARERSYNLTKLRSRGDGVKLAMVSFEKSTLLTRDKYRGASKSVSKEVDPRYFVFYSLLMTIEREYLFFGSVSASNLRQSIITSSMKTIPITAVSA